MCQHCFLTCSRPCCNSWSFVCKARHHWGVMGNPCRSASPSHLPPPPIIKFDPLTGNHTHSLFTPPPSPVPTQVSALFSHHFKTFLRYLELCLQGQASLGGGDGQPMPVGTALSHVQGVLRLLQYESFRALYTQEEHQRVTDSFIALKTGLCGLAGCLCPGGRVGRLSAPQ